MSDRDARLRVLVVDDESYNRARITKLLAGEPSVVLVAEAADGIEAVAAIRAHDPDLVFLDVQMPGKTGIEVVREIGPARMPATIFVTAYSTYAVDAFELAAVDYLVKPFDDERFEQSLARARRMIAVDGLVQLRAQLASVLRASDAAAPSDSHSQFANLLAGPYLERIAVEFRGTVRPVLVNDIDFITSDGPYAELYVQDRRYIIREALQTLEERLDPKRFMRIHRSVIVRLALVETLKRGAAGDGEVVLRSGVRLRVSRTRRDALERWLGVERAGNA